MKTTKLFIAAASIMILGTFQVSAQTDYGTVGGYADPQVIRNTNPVTYTVGNPDGAAATFTWTVTGGTIVVGGVDQASPYTALAANSIQIRWNNTNRTSSNDGTVTVSKVVDYGGGTVTCTPASDQSFDVEAWTSPKGEVTTADFDDCAGAAPSIDLAFEGRANYEYQWRVYLSTAPGVNLQSSGAPAVWASSAAAAATVNLAALPNATSGDLIYIFELTAMRDGFTDIAAGDISADNQVEIIIHPVPVVGPVNSSSSLTPRP